MVVVGRPMADVRQLRYSGGHKIMEHGCSEFVKSLTYVSMK
jgi:hypothetical protein